MTSAASAIIAITLVSGLAAQAPTPAPGLTLIDQLGSPTASLIDANAQSVHDWTLQAAPGLTAYLDADGNLLRAYRLGLPGIGSGGALERVAFDGTVLWDYTLPGPGVQHHDIEELPNGNVLCIVTDALTAAQMASLGRNPANTTPTWTADRIVEVQPTGPTSGTIVWEWRAIDHLVQDFDAGAPNFDTVSLRPERIDINYPVVPGSPLWMHMNSIDYDEVHDQIVVSCRNWSEMWVLDHSTTTAQAAGTTGGNSNKGGDLLYRWGNPAAYDTAGPQQLFWQHDATWVPPGRPGAGNLLCFNNRKGDLIGIPDSSAVTEITPPRDANGNFQHTVGTAFLPASPTWEYMAPVPTNFNSNIMGSAERLSNGNTLILSSQQTLVFEVGLNDVVVAQTPVPLAFKARRYERSMWAGADQLSAAQGGTVPLDYIPGTAHANQLYLVAGSITGASPGFQFGGTTIPLNPDAYLSTSLGSLLLPGGIGLVGVDGRAAAAFVVPPGVATGFIGTTFHHAFLVLDSSLMLPHVSNATGITFLQ